MTQSQMARLEALRRMQGFLDANVGVLGTTINALPARVTLDGAVTELVQFGAIQQQAETALTSRTKVKNDLREDLRVHHMQPIAVIAKKQQATLGVIQDLKLPGKGTKDALLVSLGTAMALAATQHSQTFIAEGLPADFIAQLQASVKAVDDAITARNDSVGDLKKGTEGVKLQFGVTHTEVKVLNALVVKALKGRADLIATWRQAKRVKAKPGVVQGGTGTTTPVVPAPVVTPVVTPAPVATPVPTPAAV